MHFLLSLPFLLTVPIILAAPIPAIPKRSLINIAPDISPTLDLSNTLGCVGVGISVCDPINVGGTQNINGRGPEAIPSPAEQDGGDDGGLVTVAPMIAPDVDLSTNTGCIGVGISVCDPINVGGTQNTKRAARS